MHWPPETFLMSLLAAGVFGVLGIVLILLGFKLFDWMSPRIDVERELAEKGNIAVAIVVGAIFIATAIVIAAAISG